MMVMVSNQTRVEFGYLAGRYPGKIGHLYGPGAQRGPHHFFPYSLDNNCYPKWEKNIPWDRSEWLLHVDWAAAQEQKPLWGAAPDIVCDWERTLEQWPEYSQILRDAGIRPAIVLQDGARFEDVPDGECMLFIGGSTGWKESAIEPWCAQFPGRVHVGRVNKTKRLMKCYRAGAVSVDGTGWWHEDSGQLQELRDYLALTETESKACYECYGCIEYGRCSRWLATSPVSLRQTG